MEELVGEQAEPLETESTLLETELGMSTKEQTDTSEAEKTTAELRRDEYIEWAVQHYLKREWIDETFTFNTDGTVIVEGNLDISNIVGSVDHLPGGLKEVKGNYSISNQPLTSLVGSPERVGGYVNVRSCTRLQNYHGIPRVIGGDLDLSYCNIPSTDGLRGISVGGDIIVSNFPVYKIPAGINLKGKISICKEMKKYKKDLEKKGYKVYVPD